MRLTAIKTANPTIMMLRVRSSRESCLSISLPFQQMADCKGAAISPQTCTPLALPIGNFRLPIYRPLKLIGNRQLKIGNASIAAFQSGCYFKHHE
jgi:hypothetical protein